MLGKIAEQNLEIQTQFKNFSPIQQVKKHFVIK